MRNDGATSSWLWLRHWWEHHWWSDGPLLDAQCFRGSALRRGMAAELSQRTQRTQRVNESIAAYLSIALFKRWFALDMGMGGGQVHSLLNSRGAPR